MPESKKPPIDRRRFPRVQADVYFRAPRVAPRKRPIHDISLGGVRISSDVELAENQELELEFFLPQGLSLVAIARVVWSKALAGGEKPGYEVGLEFMHLTKGAAEELKKVIENYSS